MVFVAPDRNENKTIQAFQPFSSNHESVFDYKLLNGVLLQESFRSVELNRGEDKPTYHAFRNGQVRGFIFLEKQTPAPAQQENRRRRLTRTKGAAAMGTSAATQGWKLHISIDDKSLPAAWDIIQKELVKHSVKYSKVVDNNTRDEMASNAGHEAGKQVTIYCFKEKKTSQQWQDLMQDTTQALKKAKIKSGPLAESDNAIKGSRYFSYRYDGGVKPLVANPFKDLHVNVKHQPSRAKPPSRRMSH